VQVRQGPDPVDAYVVLTAAVTEQQRAGLLTALRADPLVRTVSYQGRELAFERFQELWRDSPDAVRSVPPGQLSELFQVELRDRDSYPEFTARHLGSPGVADVVDWRTPAARDARATAQICSGAAPGAGR
jgi:cell division transport system permease protein